MPIVTGLAIGAALGGGIAALQGKDIVQGAIIGGLGGMAGGAFMPAAGGLGSTVGGAVGEGAVAGGVAGGLEGAAPAIVGEGVGSASSLFQPAVSSVGSNIPANMFTSGATTSGGITAGTGIGANTGSLGLQLTPQAASAAMPSAIPPAQPFGIGTFFDKYKYPMMGGLVGGMLAPGEKPQDQEEGEIQEFSFNRQRNPLFGQPGQPYFSNQTMTPGAVTPAGQYNDGGIVALADGGQADRYTRPVRVVDPAVTAYNQQLMELSNQQYNVNARPGPNQVPGSAGYTPPPAPPQPNAAAPAPVGGFLYDPVTKKYTTNEPTESEYDKLKKQIEEMQVNQQPDWYSLGYNPYATSGGGNAAGGVIKHDRMASGGGIRSLSGSHLGDYSDGGRLLKGPGDGVSDDIPATIGNKQPARLADGEFVVPARVVSELGNGSTDAGAKRLYQMMDRVQKARKKSVGKNKVAVDSKAYKHLPA